MVDPAAGEQCDAGTANGGPGSCCDATCQLVSAGTVCRDAGSPCDQPATCDGVGAACPANPQKADGEVCDDGDPATTAACHDAVCEAVDVMVDVPPTKDFPPGAKPKTIAVPFSIDIAGSGDGKARVDMQGFASCSELPAIPSDCATPDCRYLRRALAASCGASPAALTQAIRAQTPSGQVVATAKFSRTFGRTARSARAKLRLNKLGRTLLARNRTLSLQANADVRDRGGVTLQALFRTLLRQR